MLRRTLCIILLFCSSFLFSGGAQAWYAASQTFNDPTHLFHKVGIRGDERILEIGCGDGKFSALMAYMHPHSRVLGVDINDETIRFAQYRFPPTSYHNLSFKIQDANEMNYHERFDLILSISVMHFIKDQNKVLSTLWKALKKTGKLGIQMPVGLPSALAKATRELIHSKEWSDIFEGYIPEWTTYSAAEYEQLLINNQFNPLYIELVKRESVFANKELFSNFLREWFPYLKPVPKEKEEDFLNTLVDLFITYRSIDPSENIRITMDTLEIQACKI